MLDLNQEVEIKWSPSTIDYYKSLGYKYTKLWDTFKVKLKELTKSSITIVYSICDCCGRIVPMRYENYNKMIDENGRYYCRSCKAKEYGRIDHTSKEEMFEKFLDFCSRNGYNPISTIDDYINSKTKLRYYCSEHGEHDIVVGNIKHDTIGCDQCADKVRREKRKLSSDQVKIIIEPKHGKWLNPDEYIDAKTKNIKIECSYCKNVYTTSISSLKSSMTTLGCPHCKGQRISEQKVLTAEQLNEIYNKDKITLLNPQDYIDSNTKNLIFICEECGNQFITSKTNYDYRSKRCQKCVRAKSYYERVIELFLIDNNVQYIFQKRYNDCRDINPLPFDFYLPEYNICIEFDGKYHYEPIYGEERLKTTQYHDSIKTQYCKDNNIPLIRIPYWKGQDIKEILTKELDLKNNIKKVS